MSFSTRRGFLQKSSMLAAVAASGMLPRIAQAADAKSPKLGIQLYSLRGYKVDEALKHAADLGFEQVEFYSGMLPLDSSDEVIAATKKKVADLGMTISGHGVNRFTKDAAANRKMFEFAKKVGVPCMSADPDFDSFDSLNELVKEFDIRIEFTIMARTIATTRRPMFCESSKDAMNESEPVRTSDTIFDPARIPRKSFDC